jgi:hypothetical protein
MHDRSDAAAISLPQCAHFAVKRGFRAADSSGRPSRTGHLHSARGPVRITTQAAPTGCVRRPRFGAEDAIDESAGDQLRTAVSVGPAHGQADVARNGVGAQVHRASDGVVAETGCDQFQDRDFLCREVVRRTTTRARLLYSHYTPPFSFEGCSKVLSGLQEVLLMTAGSS